MTMLLVKIGNVEKSPFRNYEINPVNPDGPVVQGLVTSIKKNGHWVKYRGRPADPEITIDDLEALAAKANGGLVDIKIEQCFGHNTIAAARICKIKEMLIDVVPLDDTAMVSHMAFENKNDAKDNMMVLLETVAQVRDHIKSTIADYDEGDFKKYKTDGGSLFTKPAQFKNVKQKGVGSGTIMRVLDGWQEPDVKNSIRVLNDLDTEMYDKGQVAGMPSIGVLGQFSRLAEAILEQEWPSYFHDEKINGCAALINDPEISTTVKILKNCIKAVKDKEKGADPVKYIRNGNKSEFKLIQATKDLVFDNADEGHPELVDLPKLAGFEGFEGLDDLIKKVKTSIKKTEAARAAGEDDPEDEGEETKGEDTTTEALEAVTEATDAVADALAALPTPVDGEDAFDVPPGAMAELFTRNSLMIVEMAERVKGVVGSISDDDYPEFYEAVENLFNASAQLMAAVYSDEDCQTTLKAALSN